jgi:hypothetical protein
MSEEELRKQEVDRKMKILEAAQEDALTIEDSPSEGSMSGGESCLYYCMNIFIGIITAGLSCCSGIYTVEPFQAVIIVAFGKIILTEKE